MADPPAEPPPPAGDEDAPVERSVVSDDTSTAYQNEENNEDPAFHGALMAPVWHQQPQPPPLPPHAFPFQAMPPPPNHQALAMAQYYEARMRDHAAAYASAAAGAAWAAAQIACSASTGSGFPPSLPAAPAIYGPAPPFDGNMMGSPPYPPPPPHMLDPSTASEEGLSCRPEKRHQPMPDEFNGSPPWQPVYGAVPPSFASVGGQFPQDARTSWAADQSANNQTPNTNQSKCTKRGRRRLRSAIDSAGSSGGEGGRGGKRGSRSSDGSSSGYYNKKHPRRSRNDEEKLLSLIGKTGVSALHEYCSKKHIAPPNFFNVASPCRDEFCMTAQVANQEMGTGRGGTKLSARQDAARKAVQALLPGVVFDDDGVLVQMPLDNGILSHPEAFTSTTLEDLAPNLASRLAIASNENDDNEEDDSKKRRHRGTGGLSSNQIAGTTGQTSKRRLAVYPGTSTTSEDDDENAYYASRGASVCSALLHAMWQIKESIPEPPSYTYEVLKVERRGPSGVSSASFTCTATLLLQSPLPKEKERGGNDNEDATGEVNASEGGALEESSTSHERGEEGGASLDKREEQRSPGEEARGTEQTVDKFNVETLQAIGTGTTKREARHVASAKLLALLFPECSGMVEVKAAAEAAREEYAAAKLQKKDHSSLTKTRYRRRRRDRKTVSPNNDISFALPAASDPPLPDCLSEQIGSMLGNAHKVQKAELPLARSSPKCGVTDGIVSVAALSLSEQPDSIRNDSVPPKTKVSKIKETRTAFQESVTRQSSRQKHLEDEVDSAIQLMNELDQSSKTLSAGLTEDHVGCIVLRRAQTEDVERVNKLLSRNTEFKRKKVVSSMPDFDIVQISPISLLEMSPASTGNADVTVDIHGELSTTLWGSVAVVLLLCRAIAYDDGPPLGCAVLTLGFSMEKGRVLRISEIAHETHLPEERFIECLGTFAQNMKCSLENPTKRSNRNMGNGCPAEKEILLRKRELKSILEAHVGNTSAVKVEPALKPAVTENKVVLLGGTSSNTPLQSVKEEECEVEDDRNRESSMSNEHELKNRRDKPNKRSRVS